MPDTSRTRPNPRRSSAARTADVQWYAPGRKRPVAHSTRATSDLVGLLAEQGLTFAEARREVRYDTEAHQVLDAFISLGHGEVKMHEMGVRYG